MSKLTNAQNSALTLLAMAPQKRGFHNSGWGPWKAGERSHKVNITEGTANGLISRGLAERWDVDGDYRESTLRITPAGTAALADARATP